MSDGWKGLEPITPRLAESSMVFVPDFVLLTLLRQDSDQGVCVLSQ